LILYRVGMYEEISQETEMHYPQINADPFYVIYKYHTSGI
jgi:hypothetical protein